MMITEKGDVLCVCLLCRYESNNFGKYVSTATRTRHWRRERSFNNNDILANKPSYNDGIAATRIELNRNDDQDASSLKTMEDIRYNNDDDVSQKDDDSEDALSASSSELT